MFSIASFRAIIPAHWLAAGLIAGVTMAGPAAAQSVAGQAREGSLLVAARVLGVLRMQLLDHPRSISVSAADIARGEMTVRGGALAIASNALEGVRLRGELNDAAFRGFEMTGFAQALRQGEALMVRAAAMGPLRHPAATAVTYRLLLAANTSPGTYPWPVTLDVDPN